jgi:hypothetical protein
VVGTGAALALTGAVDRAKKRRRGTQAAASRIPMDGFAPAVDIQEDAAWTLADDLRTQIDALQTQLREAELPLEHLAITRTTITSPADRTPAAPTVDPAGSLELPEHPNYPRILAVLNDTPGPLRARDICQALDFELLPKHIERTAPRHLQQEAVTQLGTDINSRTAHSYFFAWLTAAAPEAKNAATSTPSCA